MINSRACIASLAIRSSKYFKRESGSKGFTVKYTRQASSASTTSPPRRVGLGCDAFARDCLLGDEWAEDDGYVIVNARDFYPDPTTVGYSLSFCLGLVRLLGG